MKKITIRCAKPEDYIKFYKLHKRFAYLESNSIRGAVIDEPTFSEYVERECLFVVIDETNQFVGYAFVNAYTDATCEIQEIFVAPEHQRKGYGEMLVQHIKNVAKAEGIKKISVFSIFIQTDRFWMLKCNFRPEENEALSYVIK
ncbi:MAG: GNAT family N-acetyltransferase [Clostridia bacterium]|nr:GNAT family N-acetyltransferase [Clostridia bacterium]